MCCDCQKIYAGKVIYTDDKFRCKECGFDWGNDTKYLTGYILEEVCTWQEVEQRLKVGL